MSRTNRPVTLASVITSKPANDYHFKTGQRDRDPGRPLLYPAGVHSGKKFRKFLCVCGTSGFRLTAPGRRIGQRRDATRAPTQGPEWTGTARPSPLAAR